MVSGMQDSDSIDRHIGFWKREVSDLNPQVEGIVTRMQVIVRHLQGCKDGRLAAYGLTGWEYNILWRLRAVGSPYRTTPTALAEALDTRPSTLTTRLDRMEQSGYVSRIHDSADRRRLLVALTDKGYKAWQSTVGRQAEAEHDLLFPLDDAEREQLTHLLRKIVHSAEERRAPLMPVPGDE